MTAHTEELRTDDFDYDLPTDLIAQEPASSREQSRLLRFRRDSGTISHHAFSDLPALLRPTDVLVLNDSKVIPARMRGKKVPSGGAIEILLIEECAPNRWWVMLKPGKRAHPGSRVQLVATDGSPTSIAFEVLQKNAEGHCQVLFEGTENVLDELDRIGEVPLPPYIEPARDRTFDDQGRYQTVYAHQKGSVAAPTAGLHFTPNLLDQVQEKGIAIVKVTLHVGLGTFAPIKAETIDAHQMHRERFEISAAAAEALNQFRSEGRRIVAVGTTSVRVLESATDENNQTRPQRARTNIFIYPPYRFRMVDALITNFHLPKSTLLMLVSALAAPEQVEGIEAIRRVYRTAIEQRYRFFSYGDATLIE